MYVRKDTCILVVYTQVFDTLLMHTSLVLVPPSSMFIVQWRKHRTFETVLSATPVAIRAFNSLFDMQCQPLILAGSPIVMPGRGSDRVLTAKTISFFNKTRSSKICDIAGENRSDAKTRK